VAAGARHEDQSPAERAKAKAERTLVIKGPTKTQAFLDAVDEAVEFHAHAMKAGKSPR
jgi:hypothetical protein